MMTRLWWWPVDVAKVLRDGRFLTAEQFGILFRLFCELWLAGGRLPDDEQKLQRMAEASADEWARSRDVVLARFHRDVGTIFSPELSEQLEECSARHLKLSDAGKRGNEKRWGEKQKPEPTSPEASADNDSLSAPLMEVWGFYIQQTDRNPKTYSLTPLRRRKGLARLRECLQKTQGDLANAVELMKLAVEKLAASDFHMGRDAKSNGKRFCDWESHVFKSYEQMEKWWNA